MSADSIRKTLFVFLKAVKLCYGSEYLNRIPSEADLKKIESQYCARGFPGCVCSLDCMQLHWMNCLKYWKGHYRNPKAGKIASIQVETVCDSDLYCWHVFGGGPRTNNDLTVVEDSPLLRHILNGERRMKLTTGYNLEGQVRHCFSFYLTDGIYPSRAIFEKPIQFPATLKQKNMTSIQVSSRKDIERFFGVLQGRFKILRHEMHK